MTKNINQRKIRAHHRIIAVLREFAPNPMPVTVLSERFGNDPTATNLLLRPNAWVQYACKPCDAGIDERAKISKATRGLKDQTYTLHNAFAFDALGRRYGNAEGTRLLTDDEILKLIAEGFELTSEGISLPVVPVEPELTHEDVLRNLATNTNIIFAETLFHDDENVNKDEVDYTELADNSFDMGIDETTVYDPNMITVVQKPKPVRYRENGKLITRQRAIELGQITADAA